MKKCIVFSIFFLALISLSPLYAQVVQTKTFNFTGNTQTFVIPACASTLTISLEGARGGTGFQGYPGGYGGKGTVAITPTPGVMLYVNVGGAGVGSIGGFNGGGSGGKAWLSTGGGGGGASDVRVGANTLTQRIVVVGGGGGGGGHSYCAPYGGDGGGMGCSTSSNTTIFSCKVPWGCGGANGFSTLGGALAACAGVTPTLYGDGGGGGGVTSGGGASKTGPGCYGGAGTFGNGGGGGDSVCTWGGTSYGYYGGGGGGGGYYGGGGGMAGGIDPGNNFFNGGGGGGSTFMDSTFVLSHRLYGYGGSTDPGGHGLVIIRYHTSGPAISVAYNSASVCAGNPVIFYASGANSYTWLPQPGFAGSFQSQVVITPQQSGTYTVQGTNLQGCISSTTVNVVVFTTSLQVSATPGISVCNGGTVALTASGANSYTWSGNIQNGVPFTPTASSVYTVTGIGPGGCVGSKTIQLSLGQQVIPVSGAAAFCVGQSATLTALGNNSNYQWNGGATGSIVIVSPSVSTIYTVTGSTPGGSCTGTGSVYVQVYPSPTINIVGTSKIKCLNDAPVTLSAGGALTYTWSGLPGTSTVSGGLLVVNPSITTAYTVTGVSAAGCRSFNIYSLVVDACLGIKDAEDFQAMRIYPNPTDGNFVLSAPGSFSVTINSLIGAQCEYNITQLDSARWYISGLSSGTYLVIVSDPYGKVTAKRVVIN